MAFLFNTKPSFGEALGTGLGSGLEALANQKLQQIQQRNATQQLTSGLQNLLPGQKEQAAAIANLPEHLQPIALKELLSAPGKQAYAQALGLGSPEYQTFEGNVPALNEKQATELAKLRTKEKHLTAKERAEAYKQTQKLRYELIDKGRAAKQTLGDLNRLEELEKEGAGISAPAYNEFLKNAGWDIEALKTPGSQEFNKIVANFTKNAKAYYGSRISNFELEAFMKTLPNLSQSPEGRKRVIANLKNIARLEEEGSRAARAIIKNNDNIPPLDLYEQVQDHVDKKADKFAKKFKKDLDLIQKDSSITPLATLGGSLLGSAVGLPGKAIGALTGTLGKLISAGTV